MTGNTFHEITGDFQTVTDKDALCLRIADDSIWFPPGSWKCGEPMINFIRGDEITVEVQEWILEKNDLDYLIEV